jgi:hypothetical protein
VRKNTYVQLTWHSKTEIDGNYTRINKNKKIFISFIFMCGCSWTALCESITWNMREENTEFVSDNNIFIQLMSYQQIVLI